MSTPTPPARRNPVATALLWAYLIVVVIVILALSSPSWDTGDPGTDCRVSARAIDVDPDVCGVDAIGRPVRP